MLSRPGAGPLLPSRDQQTAVNPLLKILANPLGLLRVASGHCVCHKSGITHWKAIHRVHPHLTHSPGRSWGQRCLELGKWAAKCAWLSFAKFHQKGSKIAGEKVFKFRCFKETKKKDESVKSTFKTTFELRSDVTHCCVSRLQAADLDQMSCPDQPPPSSVGSEEGDLHLLSKLFRPWRVERNSVSFT